jgi:hypothetical protein
MTVVVSSLPLDIGPVLLLGEESVLLLLCGLARPDDHRCRERLAVRDELLL